MNRNVFKVSRVFCQALGWALFLAAPPAAQAQGGREDYVRAERFLPWHASKLVFKTRVEPRWIAKSERFYYRNDTRSGKEFVLVDPVQKTQGPAFDHVKLAATLSRVSGTAYTPNQLPFDDFEFGEDGRAIQFHIGAARWTCDLTAYQCARTEKAPETSAGELRSPDGRWAAFVKDHNLYVCLLATQQEVQLTADGEKYDDYATPPDSRLSAVTDRLSGRKLPPDAIWSPDSKKLVTYRLNQRQVGEMHLIQSAPAGGGARPVLHSYRYPLPGDKEVPLAQLIVFDVEQKTKTVLQTEPQLVLYLSPIQFRYVWWSENSEQIYFIQIERGNKVMKLRRADARSGTTRTLLEERGATLVEPALLVGSRPLVRVLGGGAELIWFSQRDGWAHLYLYDGNTGALKHQITAGAWVVRNIEYVDETNRWVYFTAGGREPGRDPYYRHLYRIKLDGSNLQLLTPEDAEHQVTFSPTGMYFVDTHSRIDAAPVSLLRAADGRLIRELERADVELLLAAGWKWPEPFSVKARDGITDLYGVMFRPSNFDPKKKYPVLDSIYPGPQTIRTPKSFFPRDLAPAMAELGFVVVMIDGMGTPLRSKAFHDASYGRLGDGGGLEDHIAALRQLAARHPYLDLTRVGVYGHSGGGFASARAILAHPDFYQVAVSSAGNHDQRSYIALWGERYQGLPEGDNYLNQVTANLAGNLKGKLLLVYGDLDDNVHPAMTIQLVDALIKANKDFDLLVLPNRNHGFDSDPYFIRKRWDYFVKHLLGAEPPAGYQVRGPAQR